MHPVLFNIGPLTVYSYGLMAATGFIVATLLLARQARIEGEDPQLAFDLAFYLIIAGLVGSRILEVIIEHKSYMANPLEIFMVWKGGLAFFGGFILAAFTGLWFVKKHNLGVGKTADMIAPSLAIAHAFGRLGCLGAGCCYGSISTSWLSITFTDPQSLAPLNIPLYPTQLFSSLNELIIFAILIAVRPYKKFNGQLMLMWMMLYSVGRFIIEFYRNDPRGFLGVMSTSQIIAIVVFAVASFLFVKLWRAADNRLKNV